MRVVPTIRTHRVHEMTQPTAAFLWRKLDHPGADSCRLFKLSNGWRLSGAAVFWDARQTCQFQYDVVADAAFRTRSATVVGYLGKKAIAIRIRSAGTRGWRVNGALNSKVADCIDVDLGFHAGDESSCPSPAGVEDRPARTSTGGVPGISQSAIHQTAAKIRTHGTHWYAYEAPTVGYSGTLQVSSIGAIVQYPGLFELVSTSSRGTR